MRSARILLALSLACGWVARRARLARTVADRAVMELPFIKQANRF
jgi:hypothetical protein